MFTIDYNFCFSLLTDFLRANPDYVGLRGISLGTVAPTSQMPLLSPKEQSKSIEETVCLRWNNNDKAVTVRVMSTYYQRQADSECAGRWQWQLGLCQHTLNVRRTVSVQDVTVTVRVMSTYSQREADSERARWWQWQLGLYQHTLNVRRTVSVQDGDSDS